MSKPALTADRILEAAEEILRRFGPAASDVCTLLLRGLAADRPRV